MVPAATTIQVREGFTGIVPANMCLGEPYDEVTQMYSEHFTYILGQLEEMITQCEVSIEGIAFTAEIVSISG
jgi:hypothetical protein